jgi:hypothetical protein
MMKSAVYAVLLAALPFLHLQAQTVDKSKSNVAQDRQQLLQQLQITTLRRGPDPALVKALDPNSELGKLGLYGKVPEALVLTNGKPVTTARQWWQQRRPEIVEFFDREVYGRVPQNMPRVTWTVSSQINAMHHKVPVVIKTLKGHVDNSSYSAVNVDIQLVITQPAKIKKPVPVMMELSFPEDFRQLTEPADTTNLWQDEVLAKGWAYAMLLPVSIQADNGAGLTQGIIGLMNKGQFRKPDDWGAVRAWAWGASRALDYIVTDRSLDAKKVALEGHSRYGKTVLVAIAYDPRFAMVYSSSSGEGGAKLHRHNAGEQVENICSTGAYHWMAGNFLKYAGPLNCTDLPIDAHELIALAAPRPVFIGVGANKDDWAGPKGTFMAEVAAGPVYRLLGKKDLDTDTYPAVDEAVATGDLAFRLHHGGHTPALNWPYFIEFAAKYWK